MEFQVLCTLYLDIYSLIYNIHCKELKLTIDEKGFNGGKQRSYKTAASLFNKSLNLILYLSNVFKKNNCDLNNKPHCIEAR